MSFQTIRSWVLGTSLKLMSNYTNHVVRTPLDAPFRANAWEAPKRETSASMA